MQEGLADALDWADKDNRPKARREYEDYLRSVSGDRTVALPELDLADPEACGAAAWRYSVATIRVAVAFVRDGIAESPELDNDVLLAQMQQSMAVGW